MKMTKKLQNRLSVILCIVLAAALALFTTGCNGKTGSADAQTQQTEETVQAQQETASEEEAAGAAGDDETAPDQEQPQEEATQDENTEAAQDENAEAVDATVVGEGSTVFVFAVVDMEGNETVFEVHTDKETVGEALLDCDLIAGEDSDYGLYVKTVNGVTADYDKDGTYWAFYVNGEYASTGVDSTQVEDGAAYMFKIEK